MTRPPTRRSNGRGPARPARPRGRRRGPSAGPRHALPSGAILRACLLAALLASALAGFWPTPAPLPSPDAGGGAGPATEGPDPGGGGLGNRSASRGPEGPGPGGVWDPGGVPSPPEPLSAARSPAPTPTPTPTPGAGAAPPGPAGTVGEPDVPGDARDIVWKAGGAVVGALTLAGFVMGAFVYLRRRFRRVVGDEDDRSSLDSYDRFARGEPLALGSLASLAPQVELRPAGSAGYAAAKGALAKRRERAASGGEEDPARDRERDAGAAVVVAPGVPAPPSLRSRTTSPERPTVSTSPSALGATLPARRPSVNGLTAAGIPRSQA
eukprot:tig00020723_g13517.t1